jgi:hypothetical protein
MKRMSIVLAAASLLAAASPSPVEAHCRGCGVAAGAIIGSAIAGQPPVYEAVPPAEYVPPPPGDPDSPDYIGPASCHMELQQVWDGNAYRMRRVQVCE